jgi:hypothetical protein
MHDMIRRSPPLLLGKQYKNIIKRNTFVGSQILFIVLPWWKNEKNRTGEQHQQSKG